MTGHFFARLSLSIVATFAVAAQGADTQTPTAFDAYLSKLTTLRAEFSQVVLDGKDNVVQQAQGKFVIQRPGKFRWELTPQGADAPQLMVADGKNLWFYDSDLEQVSVKPAAQALSATPASLLSGQGDLEKFFRIVSDGERDGLQWVKVTPTRADADFREVRIAFAGFGGEIKRMDLKDKLGQTVRLQFTRSERNVPVNATEVTFTPPVGADVIGTPES